MELAYHFTDKDVRPWGGMAFLGQFLDKMGFAEQVAVCGALLRQGSNRGDPLPVLLEAFVCSVWCGATRFIHTEQTRHDLMIALTRKRRRWFTDLWNHPVTMPFSPNV